MTDACFIAPELAPVGAILRLDGAEGRHAAKVRRVRVGESVLVIDGMGQAARGLVETVGAETADIRVAERLSEKARGHRWVAVQALAKGGRDELAVETLTELGVDEVIAWGASRSVVRWQGKFDKGLAKWVSTAREATKQARRFTVPTVSYATTTQVCERIASAARAVILHESATDWLDAQFPVPVGEIVFVIGPEGGISPDELRAFTEAGGVVKRIASHVLRTSTAGVVALAQLQLLAGDGHD